jgi:hypothetical protein
MMITAIIAVTQKCFINQAQNIIKAIQESISIARIIPVFRQGNSA